MRGAHPASSEQQETVRVWGAPGDAQCAGGEQDCSVILATSMPGYTHVILLVQQQLCLTCSAAFCRKPSRFSKAYCYYDEMVEVHALPDLRCIILIRVCFSYKLRMIHRSNGVYVFLLLVITSIRAIFYPTCPSSCDLSVVLVFCRYKRALCIWYMLYPAPG